MKPLGIEFTAGARGLGMRITPSNRALDAIWEAVDEATSANMTAEQFMREVRQAWEHHRKLQLATELRVVRNI